MNPIDPSILEQISKYGFSLILNVILSYVTYKLYKHNINERTSFVEQIEKDRESYQQHIEGLWEKRLEETKIVHKILEEQTKSNNQLSESIESILSIINRKIPDA